MSHEAFLGSYPHLGVVVKVAGSSEICSAIANRMHCTVTCCLISVYRELELIIQYYCLNHMTVGNSQQDSKGVYMSIIMLIPFIYNYDRHQLESSELPLFT